MNKKTKIIPINNLFHRQKFIALINNKTKTCKKMSNGKFILYITELKL